MMQVILLQRVEKLGQMGDIVNVAPGFFRNYLFPRKFADRATKQRIEVFQQQKAQLEADNLKNRKEAETIAKKMEGLSLMFIRSAGETGQLYGSVRTKDIAEEIRQQGFTINRNQVLIEHPIKTIGLHEVYVVLHPEVKVPVTLNIALSEEEAMTQLAGEQQPEILEEIEITESENT
jgi:large subunit ribosomal protein L9